METHIEISQCRAAADRLSSAIDRVDLSAIEQQLAAASREADRLQAAAALLRRLPIGRRLPETAHIC